MCFPPWGIEYVFIASLIFIIFIGLIIQSIYSLIDNISLLFLNDEDDPMIIIYTDSSRTKIIEHATTTVIIIIKLNYWLEAGGRRRGEEEGRGRRT